MLKRILILTAALLLVLSCAGPTGPGEKVEITTLAFPQGHPEAGREVFLTMGCSACHVVAWEPGFPAPVAHPPGPELDYDLARQTSGLLATSLIAPSHIIEPGTVLEGDLSPMGDFTNTMTVRQLIDLVAYLKTQGGQEVTRNEVDTSTDMPHHL